MQGGAAHGMHLDVVKLPEAKKGFVLLAMLASRWLVEGVSTIMLVSMLGCGWSWGIVRLLSRS